MERELIIAVTRRLLGNAPVSNTSPLNHRNALMSFATQKNIIGDDEDAIEYQNPGRELTSLKTSGSHRKSNCISTCIKLVLVARTAKESWCPIYTSIKRVGMMLQYILLYSHVRCISMCIVMLQAYVDVNTTEGKKFLRSPLANNRPACSEGIGAGPLAKDTWRHSSNDWRM